MKNGVEAASIIKGKEKGKIVRLIIVENTDLKTKKGMDLVVRKRFHQYPITVVLTSLKYLFFCMLFSFSLAVLVQR
ncbi:hypothetical protein QUG02_05125 [Bacillus hominis]|uniref:Uncharacterized protein n=1 Tax=Bacillus hominis TaxID=2817478 RepID=A0ABT7R3L5_9BACI|nr:hypothetical protein [Bacillus hominis]MDM5192359.1 hypothetical protein [Bacillus hominis]MDM5432087.1 hypothetical protein [Bacillus hominis]MDM5437524.1 hypothetical protein [Bacillus hominis]